MSGDSKNKLDEEKRKFEEYKKETLNRIRNEKMQLVNEMVEIGVMSEDLRTRREKFHEPIARKEELFGMNVGGTQFYLSKVYVDKLKGTFLHEEFLTGEKKLFDKNGNIFIDRNPQFFGKILDAFRYSFSSFIELDNLQDFVKDEDKAEFEDELQYYRFGTSSKDLNLVWSLLNKSSGIAVTNEGKTAEVVGPDGDHLITICDRPFKRGVISVTVKVTIPRPNRYTLGILSELPSHYNRGFGYKNGVIGWGLHDHTSNTGIFYQSQAVAHSSMGYQTNDLVTMVVDVNKGNLEYSVNGIKCAELTDNAQIRQGVYLAATLFNKGSMWQIISTEYR